MAKQLNVNLSLTADTSEAAKKLQALDKQLQSLSKGMNIKADLGINKEISEAMHSVAKLQSSLQTALNPKTGKLDLGKFKENIDKSGLSLQQYAENLHKLGPAGQQAFSQLAQSITTAEVPLKRTNAMLNEFATTLKNTARWQISSSILHGFMGAVQSAYGYAQDLNSSLNNIRIVTGQSVEEMSAFADKANKAAKALSTTTTQYTNASLIYYQQGLSDAEVEARTNTTIKMANVSRQSAEIVSDQMTAIWNNFADGSKSLEYYADVMTALGAATASSTDEIAQGLEKFAAISETVGLSYEYATAALATVTATTRQSADVVGTAFKTLFARIQGLQLGETLEDGTTLNKYSEALEKVGISIFESNGEMKEMDKILDEMGSKWQTLSKDQQTALAQTVAGVRQYSQLMALMENYDYFKQNIGVANTSTGTLNQQAEIYAESWEAASDRVRATAEGIYEALLDDDFFIDLTNLFADFLEVIKNTVDAFGGMKGILTIIGTLMLRAFGDDIVEGIKSISFNFNRETQDYKKKIEDFRKDANRLLKESYNDESVSGSSKYAVYSEQGKLQDAYLIKTKEIVDAGRELSAQDQKRMQLILDMNQALGQRLIKTAEERETLENLAKLEEKRAIAKFKTVDGQSTDIDALKEGKNLQTQFSTLSPTVSKFSSELDKLKNKNSKNFKSLTDSVKHFRDGLIALEVPIDGKVKSALDELAEYGGNDIDELEEKINALEEEVTNLGVSAYQAFDKFRNSAKNIAGDNLQQIDDTINTIEASCNRVGMATANQAQQQENFTRVIESSTSAVNELNAQPITLSDKLMATAEVAGGVLTIFNSLKGLIDTWNNDDLSFGDKLITTFSTLATLIPVVTMAFNKNNLVMASNVSNSIAVALGFKAVDVAALTSAGSVTAFGTALWSVLWPIGLVMAAVGALIAIISGISKAVEENSVEGKLKAAEEQARKSAEAFAEVRDEVNNINSELDELQNKYDTIASMTKGTEEWYRAMADVNAQVADLLKKYPELQNYVTQTDGLLTLSQEGYDYISNSESERLNVFNQTAISDTRRANEAKINALYEDQFSDDASMGYVTRQVGWERAYATAQGYYNDPRVGEQMFTREGAQALHDALIGDLESYTADGYATAEDYENSVELMEAFLEENREVFQEAGQLYQQNLLLEQQQLEQRVAEHGLIRNSEQISDLMGETTYSGVVNEVENRLRGSVANGGFGDWNDHVNYSSEDEEMTLINDFMSLQSGQDKKYVAQRNGNLVLEIDGEEVEFTEDEVINQLTELYAGEEFETVLTERLQNNLSNVFSNIDFSTMGLEQLSEIDNAQISLQNTLNSISGINAEEVFNTITSSVGTNVEELQKFSTAFNSINFENNAEYLRKFKAAATQLDEGTISIEQFNQAINELSASTQMDNMGDYFSQTAESLGMSEDDATAMHNYAQNLMEVCDESNELSDELKTNADSAARVAIEITRMNKGIDALADGFEDWSDVLKESSETSMEYAEAMANMKKSLSDVLNVEEDLISNDFVIDHMDEIAKAAEGDEEAIESLKSVMDEEIIARVTLGQTDEFIQDVNNLHSTIETLSTELPDLEVGALLRDEQFLEAANNLVQQAGMTADEANAYFSSIGYEPVYNETDIETPMQSPQSRTRSYVENIGWESANVELPDWMGGDTEISLPSFTMVTESLPQDPVKADGSVRLVSFSGDGTPPEIQGFRRTAPASMSNYSSSNAGGKAPGSSSKKGGGSSKKKTEKKKGLTSETERYHEIKEVLEDLGRELDRIGKKKDRAWGGGKLAAINAETQAIKNQLGALKEYHSQIASNLGSDKSNASKYGWSFDGNGNVTNYEGTLAGLVNEYNAAVEAFNNSAQEDADQEKLDKAKEHYEKAKEALEQYEETKDLYEDVLDQITEATYALADAELEVIEYSVEVHLELDDNKLKLLEDIMETIGDSAARAVDNIEMIEKSIDTVLHQMETSKDGMKSIFDYIGLSGDVADRIMNGTASEGDQKSLAEILNSYGGAIDMDRVVQDLQQYQDNLLSYNEALRNYRDQVFETVNNAFTEHLEDFDRANDKIAHCVNLVSGYKDLIEAIGRKNIDVHGELTQKLNQALEAQAEDAHRAALAKEKYAQSAYQEALEGYQTAIETGDEYAINKWTEILETAQDELQAAKEDSQAALTEWANAIAESFSSAIQQVIDDLDTALGGLKLLREDFDMAQEIDAQYLDDYEKIYQLSKLTREVQASIDETDNVAAKKALMEYQSKINAYQQQGVQMSQYELDYLRAQYELELARIALEESQNAKSQVSMVKDAEGNYSYVYTADDEAVAEAEQTYEDRLYEMQRLNGDYINELQSNIITMQEEMSAKLEEIANNDLLSYEDKMLRMDEVRNYYLERIRFYDSQLGISIENNKELYDNEWTEYSAKTGYKISANEDYVDSWEETTLAILTNVETQEDYFDQLEQAINHATEEAENCCERAQDALNEAGMTTEELGQTISQTTDELIRDADDAANSAEQMSDEYQRAMQEIMNAATTFTSAYASMISSTIAQNQSLIASMQSVIQMALQMKAALAGASSSGGIGGSSGGGSGGSGGGGNSGQASSLAQSALTLLNEVHHGKYGTNGWIPGAKSAGYDQRVISLVLQALNDSKAGGGYDYFYDKAKQLLGFDTGGYTGNWGTSQGRLALLHQKELVLNAQDTPNILDAVGIVRDIAKAIDINALSAMVNGGLTAATFSNGKEEVLEQNVHITAEFPNATDKHEILEAFDNVINLAAQYANRKN